MSTTALFILLSPLLLLVLVAGVVTIVALVLADTKDIPEVASVWCSLFRQLADRTPRVSSDRHFPGAEHDAATGESEPQQETR